MNKIAEFSQTDIGRKIVRTIIFTSFAANIYQCTTKNNKDELLAEQQEKIHLLEDDIKKIQAESPQSLNITDIQNAVGNGQYDARIIIENNPTIAALDTMKIGNKDVVTVVVSTMNQSNEIDGSQKTETTMRGRYKLAGQKYE